MTKAKDILPQDKGSESQAAEKKAETPPNGAEKNLQNDAGGTLDADAGKNAHAEDAGKGANDDGSADGHKGPPPGYLAEEAVAMIVESVTEGISRNFTQLLIDNRAHIQKLVFEALPRMLAEVEASKQADAERAAKERQDAELAEQRKAEQEQRNRDRRQQREEQKAREKAAEARATEQEMSAEYYEKVIGSGVSRAEIVERVESATDFLVLFGDGKSFNIDLKFRFMKTDLKPEGGSLFLKREIGVAQDVPTATVSECWLLPVLQEGHCATGLRCDLGSAIAIGGGRPVMFPAESIAWRC